MRARSIILLGALLVPFSAGYSQTTVTGDIRTDVTWRPEGGPYHVRSDFTIADGATLTIAAGTVVEFGFSGTIFVSEGGRIVADSAIFRPIHTRGLTAAILQYQGSRPGHVDIRRSYIEHLYLYNSGGGDFRIENTRFAGEAHLRLYSTVPVRIAGCTFESKQPIRTKIGLPRSDISDNIFAPESVLYHRDAERIVKDDTLRAYGNLPVFFDNNISVSKGARLTVPAGTEIRLGYFDSFLINGKAVLEMSGVYLRAEGSGRFPAVIVSQGDGPGHAEITDSAIEDVSLQFSGGTGRVQRTDFIVKPGDAAVVNTGTTSIVATDNFWNGSAGPYHTSNPGGDGALVKGMVEFSPWSSRPNTAHATVAEDPSPVTFHLGIPYPNPATSEAMVSYDLPPSATIQWELYDMLGRRAGAGPQELQSAGPGIFQLDVSGLSSGAYILKMKAGNTSRTCKIVVTR